MRLDLSHCVAQTRAFHAYQPGNTVCLPWGRGVGKSWFTRNVGWYLPIAKWDGVQRRTLTGSMRGVRVVLLMPTLKQAKRVHGTPSTMLGELAPRGEWGFLGGDVNRTDWRVRFPGGSWIQWVSAENANDNRGIRCDVVSVDEADDVPPEVFSAVVAPWFSEPWSLRQTLIGGTPRRGRYGLLWRAHRVWPEGEGDAPPVPRHYSFHATYLDAPSLVDPRTVEQERRRLRGTPAIFEREWLCNFDSGEGVVYPFFERDFHVREPNYGVPFDEVLVGVDHGFEDPGVFLVGGVLGSNADAIVHLLEEVYERHRESSWWDDKAVEIALKYKARRQRWYADPSRPDRVASMRKAIRERAPGVHATFDETDNGIEAGVAAVADRIAPRLHEDGSRSARLYVSPSCVNTLVEIGLYRRKRDPKNKDRILDDILDRDNHAMDGLRYMVVSRFGRRPAVRYEVQQPARGHVITR